MTVSEYLDEVFIHEDALLKAIKEEIVAKGMPAISVPPITGATLSWLIKISGRHNVLEIGALGGYSGVWMARALPENGHLTSLELRPDYRDVAAANLARAGFESRTTYLVGPACESLQLLASRDAHFDFFFIDADKENYPVYLEYALKLAEPGAIIAADNTLQSGKVLEKATTPSVEAIQIFNRQVASHPHLTPLLLPIGDGLTVAQYHP